MAKIGISKQIKESTRARDMCSGPVYGPTNLIKVRLASLLSSYHDLGLTFSDRAHGYK